jgi:hypothetical protein
MWFQHGVKLSFSGEDIEQHASGVLMGFAAQAVPEPFAKLMASKLQL